MCVLCIASIAIVASSTMQKITQFDRLKESAQEIRKRETKNRFQKSTKRNKINEKRNKTFVDEAMHRRKLNVDVFIEIAKCGNETKWRREEKIGEETKTKSLSPLLRSPKHRRERGSTMQPFRTICDIMWFLSIWNNWWRMRSQISVSFFTLFRRLRQMLSIC